MSDKTPLAGSISWTGPAGAVRSVEFDGEKKCAECRRGGAAPNGLCLSCTAKAMDPSTKMRSAQGRAVQKRGVAPTPDIRDRVASTLIGSLGATPLPRDTTEDGIEPPAVAVELNAFRFGLAWQNAFLAHGEDDSRPTLYRTIAIEVFPKGVQFVGCNGVMLFRTWAPIKGCEDESMPLLEEAPDRSVVVMDAERFAIGFIKVLTQTAGIEDNQYAPVELTIERAPADEEAPLLGEAFEQDVLVIRAFGQHLRCRLYDGEFVNWRGASYGLKEGERVDGMMLSTKTLGTVGRLKGFLGVECLFHGEAKAIEIHGVGAHAEIRGLLMPMRRKDEASAEADAAEDEGNSGPRRTDEAAD